MKLKTLLVVLFVAGFATSISLAGGPPPGKGKDKEKKSAAQTVTTTSSTGTTTTSGKGKSKAKQAKVMLCHKTGSAKKPYVPIMVSKSAEAAHRKHGDIAMLAAGCPRGGGSGTVTTTTSTTTTSTTTG